MSEEAGGLGLLTRIARLEGQVDLLTRLVTVAPRGAVTPDRSPEIPTPPSLPEQVTKAIRGAARGNVRLERHLTKVAMELSEADLEPDVIAKRITDGDRID